MLRRVSRRTACRAERKPDITCLADVKVSATPTTNEPTTNLSPRDREGCRRLGELWSRDARHAHSGAEGCIAAAGPIVKSDVLCLVNKPRPALAIVAGQIDADAARNAAQRPLNRVVPPNQEHRLTCRPPQRQCR